MLLLLLTAGGYVAWQFWHEQGSGTAVTISSASAASAQQKADAFARAAAQAQQTGRAVQVVETFDDAELSALANEAARAQSLPIDQISLHATGQGTVQGHAQAHVAGQTLPVSLEGVPVVANNRVALHVTSTQVGAIPLPGPLGDQVAQSLRQPLELGQSIAGFQNLQVTVSQGQLTVSGVAEP